MDFLYPKFKEPTHKIINANSISIEYPSTSKHTTNKDYNVKDDTLVVCIRDNVGYKCNWTLIRVIDSLSVNTEYYGKEFYIASDNLKNIGNKQTYTPACDLINSIDIKALDIDPLLMETFIPYVDKKNGFYSVRIQVDYDRILDMGLFNKVLDEVYYEGVSVLLASRGLKSDNQTIQTIKNKYYTFAYIQNDLDLTVRRICEPLTFTVSIPLNFFNELPQLSDVFVSPNQVINFTNLNFLEKIDSLLTIFSSKSEEIKRSTFPDKIIENFILDFELNSIKNFAISANEIMTICGAPISDAESYTEYTVGLDNNFNLVSCDIKKEITNGHQEIKFNQGLLSMSRMRADFNNKRIFNYLINLEYMKQDFQAMEVIQFLKKYVLFPSIRLVDESVSINGIDIPPEKLKQYRIEFSKKSESCVTVTDIKNLTGTTIDFADPIYHLFVPNDPKEEQLDISVLQRIGKDFKNFKNYFDANKDSTREEFSINIDIINPEKNGINNFLKQSIGDKVKTSINTLAYVLKRIDVQQALFTRILCTLKGTDPNSTETAQFLSEIPYEIINYFNYLQMIQDLKGSAYIKAYEEGITLDTNLLCGDDVSYFIKGLTKTIKSLSSGINTALTFVKEFDASLKIGKKKNIENPYSAIINSVSNTMFSVIVEYLFDLAKNVLTEECADPILDNDINNFFDPFNSHFGIDRYGAQENNNVKTIKSNRLKAFKNTVPDIVAQLQFGTDIEYTIDLIGLLINDIRCILTPTESVNLLKGSPSEEIIVLIKNIIRNKYSKEPNNLSYLLNDDKLVLLFKNLGLTVDQKIIDSITQVTKFEQIGDICTPQQKEVRSQIINHKLPPELGVLEADNRNRIKKARQLLDKIKNGNTLYSLSALCPETEDADIIKLKTKMVGDYIDSIRSIFSTTLTNFTNEAASISKNFIEEKQLIRVDDKGNEFDNFVYNTYYFNLSNNMKDVKIIKETNRKHKILYQNLTDEEKETKFYQDLYLKEEKLNADLVYDCEPGLFTEDSVFKKYLEEERIAVNINLSYEESNERGFTSLSDFDERLINKQYYILFELNQYANDPERITITASYVYVPSNTQDRYVLGIIPVLEDNSGELDSVRKDKKTSRIRIFNNLYKYIKTLTSYIPRDILKNNFINIKNGDYDQPEETLALMQAIVLKLIDISFGRMQTYEVVLQTKEKYNQNGLFNIESNYEKDFIEKIVSVPYGSPFSKELQYKELYKVRLPGVTNFSPSLTKDTLGDLYKEIFKKINYNLSEDIIVLDYGSSDELPSGLIVQDNGGRRPEEMYFKNLNANKTEDRYALSREFIILNSDNKPEGYDWGNAFQLHNAKTAFDTDISIRDNKLIKNQKYEDNYLKNYSKLSKLDLNNDIRYKKCNIYPHYLNLDYFLNSAASTAKEELCDTNLSDVPKIILEEVIVNLTVRTYITDFMSKLAPFLSLLDKDDLTNLYKEQIIIDILREQLKQEMHLFTSDVKIDSDKDYYTAFNKLLDTFISRPQNINKIKQNLFLNTSSAENKNIDYFIRKEIKHFINFSLDKGLFSYRKQTFYKDKDLQNKLGFAQDSIKQELYFSIIYILMANSYDFEKRSIFVGTKGELFKIFFKTSNFTSTDSQIQYQEKTQEDIIKFLNTLLFSGNPAALIYTNPDYSKYIKFFLQATRKDLKSYFLRDSLRTNFNIFLTKSINAGLATAGAIGWSLIDAEEKNNLLIKESVNNRPLAHIYKRFENAKSPIPDAIMAGIVWASSGYSLIPNDTGLYYLLLDTWDEIDFYIATEKELDDLAKYALQDKERCKVDDSDLRTSLSCEDNKQELIKELDKFE